MWTYSPAGMRVAERHWFGTCRQTRRSFVSQKKEGLVPSCALARLGAPLRPCWVSAGRGAYRVGDGLTFQKEEARQVLTHVADVTVQPQLFGLGPAKLQVRRMGAIMYTLTTIEFSNRLGIVISEVPPDETDRQDQTLDTTHGAALTNSASSPAGELEKAVFGAP
jgi:hypothetical protein